MPRAPLTFPDFDGVEIKWECVTDTFYQFEHEGIGLVVMQIPNKWNWYVERTDDSSCLKLGNESSKEAAMAEVETAVRNFKGRKLIVAPY